MFLILPDLVGLSYTHRVAFVHRYSPFWISCLRLEAILECFEIPFLPGCRTHVGKIQLRITLIFEDFSCFRRPLCSFMSACPRILGVALN